jgi:hypothetical protein
MQEMEAASNAIFAEARSAMNEDAVGSIVEATWGEELFQPLQFNTFRVGPFKASTVVRDGETIANAMIRLHRELDSAAAQIRTHKIDGYLRALVDVGEEVQIRQSKR